VVAEGVGRSTTTTFSDDSKVWAAEKEQLQVIATASFF